MQSDILLKIIVADRFDVNMLTGHYLSTSRKLEIAVETYTFDL